MLSEKQSLTPSCALCCESAKGNNLQFSEIALPCQHDVCIKCVENDAINTKTCCLCRSKLNYHFANPLPSILTAKPSTLRYIKSAALFQGLECVGTNCPKVPSSRVECTSSCNFDKKRLCATHYIGDFFANKCEDCVIKVIDLESDRQRRLMQREQIDCLCYIKREAPSHHVSYIRQTKTNEKTTNEKTDLVCQECYDSKPDKHLYAKLETISDELAEKIAKEKNRIDEAINRNVGVTAPQLSSTVIENIDQLVTELLNLKKSYEYSSEEAMELVQHEMIERENDRAMLSALQKHITTLSTVDKLMGRLLTALNGEAIHEHLAYYTRSADILALNGNTATSSKLPPDHRVFNLMDALKKELVDTSNENRMPTTPFTNNCENVATKRRELTKQPMLTTISPATGSDHSDGHKDDEPKAKMARVDIIEDPVCGNAHPALVKYKCDNCTNYFCDNCFDKRTRYCHLCQLFTSKISVNSKKYLACVKCIAVRIVMRWLPVVENCKDRSNRAMRIVKKFRQQLGMRIDEAQIETLSPEKLAYGILDIINNWHQYVADKVLQEPKANIASALLHLNKPKDKNDTFQKLTTIFAFLASIANNPLLIKCPERATNNFFRLIDEISLPQLVNRLNDL